MTTEALGGTSPSGEPADAGAESVMERVGRYRLVQQLGEGGMGIVHLALDPSGRAVALKLLRPHVAHDAQARQRLSREVETLQRVRDPRVAPVLDANLTADRPYLVTRYVPGPSLDEVVRQSGPMDAAGLYELGHGLAQALEAIHAAGVIHRDLKPGNVLLADDGPVIIDFGIAHIADDIRITMTGLVMGTPGYLSPEVVEGAPVTAATDWWGWASTLAFAASGAPPFGRGPMDVVLSRVSRGDADLAAVDPRLAPLLYAALSPDPTQRPHAGVVLDALERYAAGTPVTEALPAGWDTPRPRRGEPVDRRGTQVMPPVPPPVGPLSPGGAAAAYAPVGSQPAPLPPVALPQDDPWPVPRDDLRARRTRDAPEDELDVWGEQVGWGEQEGWGEGNGWGEQDGPTGEEVDPTGPGQPDPRIGRDRRTGSLAALLVLVAALTAGYPLLGVGALVVWSLAARTADRAVTSLVVRRYHRGSRRSDVPLAVLASPWHVVVALLGTLMSLVLPAIVAAAVAYSAAFGLAALLGDPARPSSMPALAAGMTCGLLVAWWGPGGTGLRRGSRSLVRGLTPGPRSRQGLVVGSLVLAVVVVVVAYTSNGAIPDWTPMVAPPNALTP